MSVEGMEDVRESLSTYVQELTSHKRDAVHFGRHRRDEVVMIATDEYRRLTAAARHAEELERLGAVQLVRDRIKDGRYTEGTVDDLFAAADALA